MQKEVGFSPGASKSTIPELLQDRSNSRRIFSQHFQSSNRLWNFCIARILPSLEIFSSDLPLAVCQELHFFQLLTITTSLAFVLHE
jgi:hypothetical protein